MGYVIGSYSSLGFRALRKDVDWTLAETAEHLSGYQIFGIFVHMQSFSNSLQVKSVTEKMKT